MQIAPRYIYLCLGAFALLGGFYICPYVSFAPTRAAIR
nr:MAG TPA: hypothetical protein [Caudoviricetes sp.]